MRSSTRERGERDARLAGDYVETLHRCAAAHDREGSVGGDAVQPRVEPGATGGTCADSAKPRRRPSCRASSASRVVPVIYRHPCQAWGTVAADQVGERGVIAQTAGSDQFGLAHLPPIRISVPAAQVSV